MSEFKYACPVCGQHIKCDSSQAGSVMDCPTCFQKITVPQAPANADPKFILTGSKFVKKKIPDTLARAGAAPPSAPEKDLPVVIFVAILMLAVGAGAAFFLVKRLDSNPPQSLKGWRSSDIGDAIPAGSSRPVKRVFTITGAGADIWRQTDAFHFVFQPLNGDGSLTAELLNINNTHEWAKAGVMIRESTNASSAFALASIRADGQAQFLWRNAAQDEAGASGLAGGAGYPKWVKVARSGNSFSAYYKANAGEAWQRLGEAQTISMAPNTQAGLVVCSHNAGTLCQAQFAEITFSAEQKNSPTPPAAPPPVAPPASDTNWLLALGTNAISDSPVAGRIHGKDFIMERASFSTNGILTIRAGARNPFDFGLTINFGGAQAASLSGQTLNVMADADKAARVQLRWKNPGSEVQKAEFTNGYAMRLEFGALANYRLPGKIYLCTPDPEKSYLMGAFNANIPRPKALQPPKK